MYELKKMILCDVNQFGNSYKYLLVREFVKNSSLNGYREFKYVLAYRLEIDNSLKSVKVPRSFKNDKLVYVVYSDPVYVKYFNSEFDAQNYIDNLKVKTNEIENLRKEISFYIQNSDFTYEELEIIKKIVFLREFKNSIPKNLLVLKDKKEKRKEECKIKITQYLENNFKYNITKMCEDLGIVKKTFYNLELDKFLDSINKT